VRGQGRSVLATIATARQLATSAESNLDVDTERSLLLALEAVETTCRIDGTVLQETEEGLHQALLGLLALVGAGGRTSRGRVPGGEAWDHQEVPKLGDVPLSLVA